MYSILVCCNVPVTATTSNNIKRKIKLMVFDPIEHTKKNLLGVVCCGLIVCVYSTTYVLYYVWWCCCYVVYTATIPATATHKRK